MSNFKSVEYCKCDDCVHNKICMYKHSLTGVIDKLMSKIDEDKFSDDAPFILNIDCQFKTLNMSVPKVPVIHTEDKNINQVIYQPNRVVSDVDKVAQDPMATISNMNTMYKEPIQTPPSNIRTIQNGVVTNDGKPKNKKLTTEEKVAMAKNYALNQFVPKQDSIITQPDDPTNIPIQASTQEGISTEEE